MNVTEVRDIVQRYFQSLTLHEEIAWIAVGIGFVMLIVSLFLF